MKSIVLGFLCLLLIAISVCFYQLADLARSTGATNARLNETRHLIESTSRGAHGTFLTAMTPGSSRLIDSGLVVTITELSTINNSTVVSCYLDNHSDLNLSLVRLRFTFGSMESPFSPSNVEGTTLTDTIASCPAYRRTRFDVDLGRVAPPSPGYAAEVVIGQVIAADREQSLRELNADSLRDVALALLGPTDIGDSLPLQPLRRIRTERAYLREKHSAEILATFEIAQAVEREEYGLVFVQYFVDKRRTREAHWFVKIDRQWLYASTQFVSEYSPHLGRGLTVNVEDIKTASRWTE